MVDEPWYGEAFLFLEKSYSKEGAITKVSGVEFLSEYFFDLQPKSYVDQALDASSIESSEEYARNCVDGFESWLKKKKRATVLVGRSYQWKVQAIGDKFEETGAVSKRRQPLEYGLELGPEEEKVFGKPVPNLILEDLEVLYSLSRKILGSGDTSNIADVSFRLATVVDLSRAGYQDKAVKWVECAEAKAVIGDASSYEMFKKAALIYAINLDHLASAKLYERALQACPEVTSGADNYLELVRAARRQYELSYEDVDASRLYITECDRNLAKAPWLTKKLPLLIYKIVSNYGESPLRVFRWAFGVIVVCALLYMFFGLYSSGNFLLDSKGAIKSEEFDFTTVGTLKSLGVSFYYSVVTFTTLGYGDFSPANSLVRAISSFQALTGLLLSSLFMVTVVRKYSR